LEAGPGGTFRWLIGDIYYARAIRARDRKDWDAALSAHLATLAWAPSRIANWLGYGETARRAMLDVPQRPFQWTEYGRLGYYRAQLMQPINSYTFYGEAEMLAQAYQKGGKTYYDPARKDFEKAILLAPNYPRFRLDYGALLESAGQVKSALTQYLEAARSGGSEGEAEWRLGRLLVSQGQRQEGLRYLQAAERMSRTSPLHPQIQATLDAVASP
jgi:tetratricopeptide (TPR) repeat protein